MDQGLDCCCYSVLIGFLIFDLLGFLTFYSPGSDGEDGGSASSRAGLPAEHPL